MSVSPKSAAAYALAAILRSMRPLRRIHNLWAFAKLQAALAHRVPVSTVVLGTPDVHGTGNIRLGADLYLYADLHLETQESGAIEIGDRVVISRGTHIVAFDRVEIGEGTMIGEYVSIRDANHIYGQATNLRDAGHTSRSISIGRNVWIGRGAAVLSGVRIGDDAVVGANAVVTRDVPCGAVVVGVPAAPIANRRAA